MSSDTDVLRKFCSFSILQLNRKIKYREKEREKESDSYKIIDSNVNRSSSRFESCEDNDKC